MTVAVAVLVPPALAALRVYTVETAGATVQVDRPVTDPMPWSRLRLVAPLTVQLRVALPPEVIVEGLAVKELMVGDGGATMVIVAKSLLEGSAIQVAVNVYAGPPTTALGGAVHVQDPPAPGETVPPVAVHETLVFADPSTVTVKGRDWPG